MSATVPVSWAFLALEWAIAALLGLGLIAEVASRWWLGRKRGTDAVEAEGDKAADRLITLYEKQIDELNGERKRLTTKVDRLEGRVKQLETTISGIMAQLKASEECEIARECPSRVVPGERRLPDDLKAGGTD